VAAPIVLASASPRRARILKGLRIPFRIVVPQVDETARPGEAPAELALRLAREKASAVAARETLPVLAADTVVVCEGRVLGKPASAEEARGMLRRLQGREHEVLTGVCLASAGQLHSGLDRSRVCFVAMADSEIDWYVATGEPLDKAGAYHVDGLGALFIERVDGSPSGIAGLPIRLVLELARAAGLEVGVATAARRG
jgi:septum formation protein